MINKTQVWHLETEAEKVKDVYNVWELLGAFCPSSPAGPGIQNNQRKGHTNRSHKSSHPSIDPQNRQEASSSLPVTFTAILKVSSQWTLVANRHIYVCSSRTSEQGVSASCHFWLVVALVVQTVVPVFLPPLSPPLGPHACSCISCAGCRRQSNAA